MSESFVKTLAPEGLLDYRSAWLAPADADRLLDCLAAEVPWELRSIRMFGRELMQPRLLCFMGDPGMVYRYSGGDYAAVPWHPAVEELRWGLNRSLATAFNSVLLNLYRDGSDSMGWHADDEPELGSRPTIASISLGAERRFVLRRRDDPRQRLELVLAHGSLLLMAGDLQTHWQHQLPKTARPVGPRLNLTFRRIHPKPGPRH